MKLVRVEAPHFVAAFETDGVVQKAAPILKFALGWSDDRARSYFARKGWKAIVVCAALPVLASCTAAPVDPFILDKAKAPHHIDKERFVYSCAPPQVTTNAALFAFK